MGESPGDSGTLRLSDDQVRVFAAGLYHLAATDGVSPGERALIEEFCRDAGAPALAAELDALTFDPVEAYEVLETTWLRTLFLRAALRVIESDGRVSQEEQEALHWMATAFGVPGGYEALAAHVRGGDA